MDLLHTSHDGTDDDEGAQESPEDPTAAGEAGLAAAQANRVAVLLADLYDVPVVFAKKGETANSTDDKYISQAYSFTHKKMNSIFVSKPYMLADDKVLIVDDFLADGQAMSALIDIVHQAGGTVVGCGVAIEKGVQDGGRRLREQGYHVESIAIVDEMDYEKGTIRFR